MTLKPETVAEIDALVPRYPQKRSAVLPLLHLVQAEQGHISDAAVEWIAARLELQPINVYELVTFYPSFRRQPIGRHHLRVCRTLPCALVGSYKTCQALCEAAGIDHVGGTAPDGSVTVEFAECLAGCGMGPVVLVDETLHERVDEARARALAAQLKHS